MLNYCYLSLSLDSVNENVLAHIFSNIYYYCFSLNLCSKQLKHAMWYCAALFTWTKDAPVQPSQWSLCRKMPQQNMFHFDYDYEARLLHPFVFRLWVRKKSLLWYLLPRYHVIVLKYCQMRNNGGHRLLYALLKLWIVTCQPSYGWRCGWR